MVFWDQLCRKLGGAKWNLKYGWGSLGLIRGSQSLRHGFVASVASRSQHQLVIGIAAKSGWLQAGMQGNPSVLEWGWVHLQWSLCTSSQRSLDNPRLPVPDGRPCCRLPSFQDHGAGVEMKMKLDEGRRRGRGSSKSIRIRLREQVVTSKVSPSDCPRGTNQNPQGYLLNCKNSDVLCVLIQSSPTRATPRRKKNSVLSNLIKPQLSTTKHKILTIW